MKTIVTAFDAKRDFKMCNEEFMALPRWKQRRLLGLDPDPISGGAESRYIVPSTSAALVAATAKSAILVAPGTNVITYYEWYIGFDGAAAQQAVTVDIYRVNSLGSPAGTSKTPMQVNVNDGVSDATALVNLTTEPTSIFILKSFFIPPSQSLFIQSPLSRELVSATTGARVGIRATSAAGSTPNMISDIEFSE